MKVSILLVSYNQAKYIKECVESILIQETSFDVEIIVADDFSTDTTLEIITNLLATGRFTCKVLTSDQNLGMRLNYKRGFAACTGEYIAIMEGDDYWCDSKRLKKHIAFLESSQDCVMTFNRLIILNEEKGTFKPQKWEGAEEIEYITTPMLIEQNCIGNLSACVIRKSAFKKLEPDIHDIGFADWLLGMAMGELGTLVKFGDPMSVYRVHKSGLWSGIDDEKNLKKLIHHTIDKYDNYLGYRYHKEFIRRKKNLQVRLKKGALKRALHKYIPPSILKVGKFVMTLSNRKLFL